MRTELVAFAPVLDLAKWTLRLLRAPGFVNLIWPTFDTLIWPTPWK